ncbi:PucR family transcriptional regulator [Salipaludibacillus neizhouensis]|uniref:PucR family transcriptional regulator n=1 Tax=Salipaludibacillus neizhouensis TaxID=885475 RepID=A0A3A9K7P7_9BACI|nr:PucR family transcriptional regulator [Salipaludibacillus neizhouensis]RKL68249.1 PucR family transcriptional regulator [Salipaludibacillus neizhouensis]
MQSMLTIGDILDRKYFSNIEVVAGATGLGRQVKWVHVVEVIKIKSLLNGNELILTTGLGWKTDEALFMSLLKQLIECNASGLCIEMGTSTSSIPQEIVDYANTHHFPIIIFHEEVPFVEITQDIHSLLINKQYQMISDLENYTQQLNKKMLEIDHYEEILTFFHRYLDVQIIAKFNMNDIKFIPELGREERERLLLKINRTEETNEYSVAKQPVQLLGNQYAEIIIFADTRELSEYDYLLLDRTATALAQHLLRDLLVEEKKRMEETEWMLDWLDGEHSEEEIREYLSYHQADIDAKDGVVCVCRLSKGQIKNMDSTYFKLVFRTIFEQYGFSTYSTEVRNQLIFIFVNQRESINWRERMEKGFMRFKTNHSTKLDMSSISFGVGKFVGSLKEIHKSYQAAKETLLLQHTLPESNRRLFYDDLHIYHIISLINKHGDLPEMVMNHLTPVIEYDKKNNGTLLYTLKTYLACNGSKQETAKKLYVVRQTLYHRIDKLEKLLGEDFMSPEKRLVMELMLVAHDYLVNQETKKSVE